MGYFDYLEESSISRKETQFFDRYAKIGFWLSIGALGGVILSIIVLAIFGLGKIIWLDIIPGLVMVACLISIIYCRKTLRIARDKEKKSPLALMSLPWAILYALIAAIIIVMNTWIYFS